MSSVGQGPLQKARLEWFAFFGRSSRSSLRVALLSEVVDAKRCWRVVIGSLMGVAVIV